MKREAFIALMNVDKLIGKKKRIDNVSLHCQSGKIYGLIGPNGSGKTTLMNLITGFYQADKGEVSVCGYSPIQDYKKVRTLIGLAPQEVALYPELSARENLLFHAALHLRDDGQIKQKVEMILELVELQKRADEPVKNYSGGMKRRLSIGRALLTDPKVVLLDEPTLGVDVQSTHKIWEYIKRLKSMDKVILVASNVMNEAEALSDEVIILDNGKKIVQATLSDLKKTHGGEKILIKFKEALSPAHLRELLGTYHQDEAGYLILEAANGEKDLLALIEKVSNRYEISSIALRKPTLDDIFLEKTGRALRN